MYKLADNPGNYPGTNKSSRTEICRLIIERDTLTRYIAVLPFSLQLLPPGFYTNIEGDHKYQVQNSAPHRL